MSVRVRTHTPLWLWPNLLSLDAPFVAVLWQDFLARCYPAPLHPAGRCVLGLTVWAIYLADRLFDVRHPPAADESARHAFYRRHSLSVAILLTGVTLLDLLLALVWLRPAVFVHGLWVGAAVALYLTVFAFWRAAHRYTKQPVAAILFTAGVFLVGWTRTPHPQRTLFWPAVFFCALCLGNLLLLETWETGRSTKRGWLWLLLLALSSCIPGFSAWYMAIGLSAAGLALLDLRGGALSATARHVLADAVLLTPLLFTPLVGAAPFISR